MLYLMHKYLMLNVNTEGFPNICLKRKTLLGRQIGNILLINQYQREWMCCLSFWFHLPLVRRLMFYSYLSLASIRPVVECLRARSSLECLKKELHATLVFDFLRIVLSTLLKDFVPLYLTYSC